MPDGERRTQPAGTANRIDVFPEAIATEELPEPDDVYDAGPLGCGDGPLMNIAAKLRSMAPGTVLEIRSTDPGVGADLPPWCRMVGHTYLGGGNGEYLGRYFVRRKHS
jgi:TusA-related sulfurtransferase